MRLIQTLITERKRQNLNVPALSARSGITAANLYRTEKGSSSMGIENFERWADALGMQVTLRRRDPQADGDQTGLTDALGSLLDETRTSNKLLTRLLDRPALTLHGTERDDDYSSRQELAMRRDEATRETLAAEHQESA